MGYICCNTNNDNLISQEIIVEGFDNKLQQILDNKVNELNISGIQASIRINDSYWQSTSGSIEKNSNVALLNHHILRIGSVTKIFTAAIILKLYELEKIGLDDRINKWLPEYPNANLVTIRQLLNHSSGIYNYTENFWIGIQTALFSRKKWNPNTLLESTYKKPFYFNPGEGYYYSNTNYLILGLIIEKITGDPLAKVYRDYIFTTYKLNNTFFVPYEETPENLISGYDRDVIPFGIHKVVPKETSFATLGFSAGAIVSTADDLRKWIDSLLKSFFQSESTLIEMMNYLEAEDQDVHRQIGYALGLRVLDIDGDIIYGHTGTIPGFGAAVFYCPVKNYSIALGSNVSLFDQISVLEDLIFVINKKNE